MDKEVGFSREGLHFAIKIFLALKAIIVVFFVVWQIYGLPVHAANILLIRLIVTLCIIEMLIASVVNDKITVFVAGLVFIIYALLWTLILILH